MTQSDKKRLIEDFLPIAEISYHAAREKSIRDGHISTLHLWWARRPLAAARAAVAGTLLPAPANQEQRDRLKATLAEACAWAGSETSIAELRRMILANNGGQPPKVLDMFAGGGAIPLEAARLGCESYAVDLNPVAHIIELCTLVYPQTYGPSLATDVRKWARWVLDHSYREASDIYPFPADPGPKSISSATPKTKAKNGKNDFATTHQLTLEGMAGTYQRNLSDLETPADLEDDTEAESDESQPYGTVPPGHLMPVAYLWTRTVICPNTMCRAMVPLARQLWLAKTAYRKVAMRPQPNPITKKVDFVIEEVLSNQELSFNPDNYSKRGNTSCPFCGTAVDDTEVKRQGFSTGLGSQLTAIVCTNPGTMGKIYLDAKKILFKPEEELQFQKRLRDLMQEAQIEPFYEELQKGDSRNFNPTNYGMVRWEDLFSPRQMLILMTFLKWSKLAYKQMLQEGMDAERAKAITTYLGVLVDRLVDYNSKGTTWVSVGQKLAHTYPRQGLSMVWDYGELNPFGGASGSYAGAIDWVVKVIAKEAQLNNKPVKVQRGSATQLQGLEDNSMDAVITDPPYYDNVSYAALSDFFYVWLKRSIGDLYPEHFSYLDTPKKLEAVAEPARQNKSKEAAREFYEGLMGLAFAQAYRVIKPEGRLVVVYAHKTTYGWSTLVDALRQAQFVVTEAWPIDTERSNRLLGQGSAALASSIFIVAKKRRGQELANFRRDVKPELDRIIAERIQTLMENKVSGADLVIATVGAALSAFTRWERVELDNGEELDSVRFLEMVQGAVVDMLMRQALATEEGSVSALDKVSQFYVLARFQYDYQRQPTILPRSVNGKKPPAKKVEKPRSGTMGNWVDFDEMNVLARGIGVEMNTLMSGPTPLVKKEKDKVALLGFAERGGMDGADNPKFTEGKTAVDVLHQLLWLLNNPGAGVALPAYFDLTGMDSSKVSLLAHTLAGKALSGGATEAADGTTGMSFSQSRTQEQKMIDNLLVNFEGRLGRKGFI